MSDATEGRPTREWELEHTLGVLREAWCANTCAAASGADVRPEMHNYLCNDARAALEGKPEEQAK